MAWTLEDDGGTEKSLDAWGIAPDWSCDRHNQAADRVVLTVIANTDSTAAFDYDDDIIIRRDRSGSGTSWSAGSIYFQGKISALQRLGSAHAESLRYEVAGPWRDFERCVFQQSRKEWNGSTLVDVYLSELFLGRTSAGVAQTTGAQITEAVNWAITCGANCQLGTIDPAVNIVSYEARDITVAEAIKQMLRWSPDVIAWFDYTSTPPTFHARKLSNLTAATVTVPTDKVASLDLRPRHELQLSEVFLKFKTISAVDGTPYITYSTQKYPVGATGQVLDGMFATIELEGFKLTRVTGSLVCEAINAQSATESTRIAWWKKHEQNLKSDKLGNISIASATVTDPDGTTVVLASYPNELISGQVAGWMGGSTKNLIIKATATYDLYADTAQNLLVESARQRELVCRVVATDLDTDDYEAAASYESGETQPSGLAQSLYDAHQTLQYDGTIELTDEEVPTGLGMGYKLSLAGLSISPTNLMVQGVSELPNEGRMVLQIGVATHLGFADLIELLRVNRARILYNSISSMSTGEAGGAGGNVELGDDTSKENTGHGLGVEEIKAVLGPQDGSSNYPTIELVADGSNHQLDIKEVTSAGATVSASGQVLVELSRTYGQLLKIREAKVCLDDGSTGYVLLVCSEVYSTQKIGAETPIGET